MKKVNKAKTTKQIKKSTNPETPDIKYRDEFTLRITSGDLVVDRHVRVYDREDSEAVKRAILDRMTPVHEFHASEGVISIDAPNGKKYLVGDYWTGEIEDFDTEIEIVEE